MLSSVRRRTILCCAILFSIYGQPALAQGRFATVARVCEQVRQDLNAPGLSVAVSINDILVWSSGFGEADVENDVPARGDTVYRIASLSKTFGATAVMQLVDSGRVNLDDRIEKYVPSVHQAVTIRQILTHTSGIRHYKPGESVSVVRYNSLADAIAVFRDDPLVFPPGTNVLYSSYAYNLLAGVIETASGKPLETYLKERIFEPAHLESIELEYPERIVSHRARAYVRDSQKLYNAPYVDNSIKWIGGGLISSAEDLVRFSIALDRGVLVSVASMSLMNTPGRLNDGTPVRYSLGWEVSERDGVSYVDKYGSGTGVSAYLLRIPDKGFAVAVLVNVSHGNIQPFALRIANAVRTTEEPVHGSEKSRHPRQARPQRSSKDEKMCGRRDARRD